jgi:hypothetical protein
MREDIEHFTQTGDEKSTIPYMVPTTQKKLARKASTERLVDDRRAARLSLVTDYSGLF